MFLIQQVEDVFKKALDAESGANFMADMVLGLDKLAGARQIVGSSDCLLSTVEPRRNKYAFPFLSFWVCFALSYARMDILATARRLTI